MFAWVLSDCTFLCMIYGFLSLIRHSVLLDLHLLYLFRCTQAGNLLSITLVRILKLMRGWMLYLSIPMMTLFLIYTMEFHGVTHSVTKAIVCLPVFATIQRSHYVLRKNWASVLIKNIHRVTDQVLSLALLPFSTLFAILEVLQAKDFPILSD